MPALKETLKWHQENTDANGMNTFRWQSLTTIQPTTLA